MRANKPEAFAAFVGIKSKKTPMEAIQIHRKFEGQCNAGRAGKGLLVSMHTANGRVAASYAGPARPTWNLPTFGE